MRENAPWWTEVSKCAPQEAFRDLEKAFKAWRAGRTRLPRFKRKKLSPDNKARLTGKMKSKEPREKLLRLLEEGKAKMLSATVSREADRWDVSLTCEVERAEPKPKEVRSERDVVGVDLGLSAFAVLPDDTRIEAPKPLAKKLKLLKRRSKGLSRKQEGSNNQKKAALALARLHRKVRNLRQDFLHKLTTKLAKTKPALVVEDPNVKGLFRGCWYKAKWYGATLVVVPRSFPSTRLCSWCGHLHGRMPLSERVFRCEACGLEMDRDLNTALNLKAYGLAHRMGPTGSSPGSHARGDSSSGGTVSHRDRSTSHGSWKREVARGRRPLGG